MRAEKKNASPSLAPMPGIVSHHHDRRRWHKAGPYFKEEVKVCRKHGNLWSSSLIRSGMSNPPEDESPMTSLPNPLNEILTVYAP